MPLSDDLLALIEQNNKEPQIILEIEGSNYIYGTGKILETAKWDDDRITWDNEIGVTWDGEVERNDSKAYITTRGTTKSVSETLLVDEGGAGSVSNMTIALVDVNREVGRDLSFDNIGDPLGKKANIYFTVAGGIYPQDALEIMRGTVQQIDHKAGLIAVNVKHPAAKKRQPIIEIYNNETTAAIDAVTTSIPVRTSNPFVESGDILTSYIKIDDEIMEVVSKTDTTFTVIRERLNTIAAPHDNEAAVESIHYLNERPIPLNLKILHSNENNTSWETEFKINALNQLSNVNIVPGAILIDYYDIQERLGIVIGDFVELVGTSYDGTYAVTDFGTLDTGKSYLVVDSPLGVELGLDLNLKVKSKYNVLPNGAGLSMFMDEINTERFEEIESLYFASFQAINRKVDESIEEAKVWLDEMFKNQALYNIPEGPRVSCRYTTAPLSIESLPILNETTLKNVTKIIQTRSTHKYYKNGIIYRYNELPSESKFIDKELTFSPESNTRISDEKKYQVIEEGGLPRGGASRQAIQRISSKMLNRYKFAAKLVKNVKTLFKTGLQINVGSIVWFGGENLQLTNLDTGERDLPLEQYEVIAKDINYLNGDCTLTLLQTNFSLDGLFGVFSPASKLTASSTVNRLFLKQMFEGCPIEDERDKWTDLIGSKIRVRSPDFSFDEVGVIDRFDQVDQTAIYLEDDLSFAPGEDYIIELADYSNYLTDSDIDNYVRTKYTFTMPSDLVTGVTNSQIFDVSDASKFAVGMEVTIHNDDYTDDSSSAFIDDITGSTITLDSALDITIEIGDRLEVLSFTSEKGYRLV